MERASKEIEKEARRLWLDLGRRRSQIWDQDLPPEDPIDWLDPFKITTHILGAKLVQCDDFPPPPGAPQRGNLPYRIGGYTDPANNTIGVSRRFRLGTRRFTLAHSIGHWQFHRGGGLVDEPLVAGDRAGSGKSRVDREASLFAEELLMPESLLKPYFQRIVGADTLRNRALDESLAQWLSLGSYLRVTTADLLMQGRERVALLVSDWSGPTGTAQCLPPLADRFRVSSLAMAIRLQRLNLV